MDSSIMPSYKSPFRYLPNEIIYCIADVCPTNSLWNLIRCNKHLYNLLRNFLRRRAVTSHGIRAAIWAASRGSLEFLIYLSSRGVPILHPNLQFFAEEEIAPFDEDEDENPHDDEPDLVHEFPEEGDDTPEDFILKYNASMDLIQPVIPLFTLLCIASARGHDHTVSWFLDNGHVSSRNLTAALALAVGERHLSTTKVLIENGARAMGRHWDGHHGSALHVAVTRSDFETAKFLIESGSYDLGALNGVGLNPLGLVLYCEQRVPPKLAPEAPTINMDFLRLLLKAEGSLTNFVDREDLTPLHAAILVADYEAATEILDAGASPHAELLGYQALHFTFNPYPYVLRSDPVVNSSRPSQLSKLRFLKALLAAGADPNAVAGSPEEHRLGARLSWWDAPNGCYQPELSSGGTPLMFAAAHGSCLDSITTLIEHGADVNAVDEWGENALLWTINALRDWKPKGEPSRLQGSEKNRLKRVSEMDERRVIEVCTLLAKHGCDPAAHDDETDHNAIPLLETLLESLWDGEELADKLHQAFLEPRDNSPAERSARESVAEEIVSWYLQRRNQEGLRKVRSVEHMCLSYGLNITFTAADLMYICRRFRTDDRFANEIVEYFREMMGFAERHGLIRVSEEGRGGRTRPGTPRISR